MPWSFTPSVCMYPSILSKHIILTCVFFQTVTDQKKVEYDEHLSLARIQAGVKAGTYLQVRASVQPLVDQVNLHSDLWLHLGHTWSVCSTLENAACVSKNCVELCLHVHAVCSEWSLCWPVLPRQSFHSICVLTCVYFSAGHIPCQPVRNMQLDSTMNLYRWFALQFLFFSWRQSMDKGHFVPLQPSFVRVSTINLMWLACNQYDAYSLAVT